MKKFFKYLASLAIVAFLVLPVFALPTMAQNPFGLDEVNNAVGETLGGGNTDLRVVIGRIINFALGFLGVIAIIIILVGGFKWMTAGGNEEKTADARKLLVAGIIGLVIILAAWAITTFVIGALHNNITGVNTNA